MLGPRLVIAGTQSGVGKTSVATGLMAAFRAGGDRVASAKVGPDFIDPGYHALATGRFPRNLDPWMSGAEAIGPLASRASSGADVLVIEGVMGLFDGAVDGTASSTADVAQLIDAPVVLVVDGSSMSASVAAVVRGFRDHRPGLDLAGVILNKVSTDAHRTLLTEALESIGVAVLGTLPRNDAIRWRDRHLGLVPVQEQPASIAAAIQGLAGAIAEGCDLERLRAIAAQAPPSQVPALEVPFPVTGPRPRVAIASSTAFTFMYRDNIEALESAGAELVEFDPLVDERLPSHVSGLVIGGGFPEEFARRLSDNEGLLVDVNHRIDQGLITWAECGGLLWLATSLDDRSMVGSIETKATMTDRLALGYRSATALHDNPVLQRGQTVRGHEFHYSTAEPAGDALTLASRFGERREGFATSTLFATYLHIHLGAKPNLARRFVEHCTKWSRDDFNRV